MEIRGKHTRPRMNKRNVRFLFDWFFSLSFTRSLLHCGVVLVGVTALLPFPCRSKCQLACRKAGSRFGQAEWMHTLAASLTLVATQSVATRACLCVCWKEKTISAIVMAIFLGQCDRVTRSKKGEREAERAERKGPRQHSSSAFGFPVVPVPTAIVLFTSLCSCRFHFPFPCHSFIHSFVPRYQKQVGSIALSFHPLFLIPLGYYFHRRSTVTTRIYNLTRLKLSLSLKSCELVNL